MSKHSTSHCDLCIYAEFILQRQNFAISNKIVHAVQGLETSDLCWYMFMQE